MRLINIHTMEMKEFAAKIPPYAILSHRWTDDEITFKDYKKGKHTSGAGFHKIRSFAERLKSRWWRQRVVNVNRQPGKGPSNFSSDDHDDDPRKTTRDVEWIWVDTCCIDKGSSAELSEAINAMWTYYSEARFCLVHLADVKEDVRDDQDCRIQVSLLSRTYL